MRGVVLKYIMTYILPIPIYLFSLFLIFGLGGEMIEKHKTPEFIAYIQASIEFALVISLFNFLAYKSSLKYLEINKARKIYKGLIIFNLILSVILICFIL